MRYARIKLLKPTKAFPAREVGDVFNYEYPTCRHLVAQGIAEMIDDDLAASADVTFSPTSPEAAAVEPTREAVTPAPKVRKGK
jgi:hypothetical protein